MESEHVTRSLNILLGKQNEMILSHNTICDGILALTEVINDLDRRLTAVEDLTGGIHEHRFQKLNAVLVKLTIDTTAIQDKIDTLAIEILEHQCPTPPASAL